MLNKGFLLCCTLFATAIPGSLLAQSVIYEELFTTSSDVSTSTFGWVGHRLGTGDLLASVPGGAFPTNAYIGGGASSSPGDTGNGYLFFSASGNVPFLAWTDEFSFDPAGYSDISVEFWMRNNSSASAARVAVQIGGSWFASDTSFSTSLGSGTWAQQNLDFSFTGSAWRDMTFDGTSSASSTVGLSVAGTARSSDLPSGSISAFGIFVESTSSAQFRLDPFRISGTAVPESSTFALIGGLLAICALRLRRRV